MKLTFFYWYYVYDIPYKSYTSKILVIFYCIVRYGSVFFIYCFILVNAKRFLTKVYIERHNLLFLYKLNKPQ